jgi:hypothetical protein
MSSCPYTPEELDRWDGVNNPMGDACKECGEFECEHNFNMEKDGCCPDPELARTQYYHYLPLTKTSAHRPSARRSPF